MPHTVTGEIRRDVFTKEGQGAKGPWKMYGVDLSEMVKDRDGNKHYANYRATFFASSDAMRNWYDDAFQKGKIISVSCEKLKVEQRDTDSGTYITLSMEQPSLTFSQRGEASAPPQQQDRSGWGQPQQNKQENKSPPKGNEPPMDFDDEIPF